MSPVGVVCERALLRRSPFPRWWPFSARSFVHHIYAQAWKNTNQSPGGAVAGSSLLLTPVESAGALLSHTTYARARACMPALCCLRARIPRDNAVGEHKLRRDEKPAPPATALILSVFAQRRAVPSRLGSRTFAAAATHGPTSACALRRWPH